MKALRFPVVLLATLFLGLSFVFPAEDIPETPYDESEALPYEATPLFSIVLQESAGTTQSVKALVFPLQFTPPIRRGEILIEQSERTSHLQFRHHPRSFLSLLKTTHPEFSCPQKHAPSGTPCPLKRRRSHT